MLTEFVRFQLVRLLRFSSAVTTHDIRCTVQKALISGWYPVIIPDIRLLDSVKTWLFLAILKFFTLWPLLSTDFWLIFWYIQQIYFNILLKSVGYLIEIRWIHFWYPFITPLIRSWYHLISWYLVYRFQAKFHPLVFLEFGEVAISEKKNKFHLLGLDCLKDFSNIRFKVYL